MRLIDADAADINEIPCYYGSSCYVEDVETWLNEQPILTAIPVPCKIGEVVYGIRNYKGIANVQKGFVSEMFFTKDMKLMVVVKHVCRGNWLEKVFPTREAAEAAIRKDGDGNG